ncbi:hypothetical protein LNT22_23370, partial [Klebsiella pneumoniae]|nr:hypothetical protein [Klebsiella pneumoniae]
MAFPVDGVIQFTLNKMNERIRQHAEGAPVNEQSGLIFMGNVHDAVPRRLFLDSRLSALDKMAWVMIRLYVVVKFFWTRRSDGRVMHRRATGRQG